MPLIANTNLPSFDRLRQEGQEVLRPDRASAQDIREHGLPHQLLVLADLSRALREEEQLAWKRLVRVTAPSACVRCRRG